MVVEDAEDGREVHVAIAGRDRHRAALPADFILDAHRSDVGREAPQRLDGVLAGVVEQVAGVVAEAVARMIDALDRCEAVGAGGGEATVRLYGDGDAVLGGVGGGRTHEVEVTVVVLRPTVALFEDDEHVEASGLVNQAMQAGQTCFPRRVEKDRTHEDGRGEAVPRQGREDGSFPLRDGGAVVIERGLVVAEAEEAEVVEPGGGDSGQGLIELKGGPRTAKAAEGDIHSALLTAGCIAGH